MNIKRIDYNGKWPNLCRGTVSVFFDNGQRLDLYDLLRSGGSCFFRDENAVIEHGDWKFHWGQCQAILYNEREEIIAEDLTALDLITLVEYSAVEKWIQENVPEGCCGGCL